MNGNDTTIMTEASTVADDSDDDTVDANDFLEDQLSSREAKFIDQMKDDELQHVQHFIADKNFRNVILSELDYVPTKQEQAYEVENLSGCRLFFTISVKVRPNLQQIHANHDRSDYVAFPVPASEVVIHMLMKEANELSTNRSADKTADDAVRRVYFRLWPTVPPGLLARSLLFAVWTVFGARALIRFASVDGVQNSLTSEFGKIGSKSGPGLTTPAEDLKSSKRIASLNCPHLRAIAKRLWRENGDDNSKFDPHFDVDGFKPPKRKHGHRNWMLDPSTKMAGRYNRNEKQILEVIGKPFDMWKERSDYDNIDAETLLVELADFRQWFKEKMLADNQNLIRDRKPLGTKRRIIPVCSSGQSVYVEASRLANVSPNHKKAVDYTARAFEKSGRVDTSKANFTTFVKPNVSYWIGAGASREAANSKTPLPRQTDADNFGLGTSGLHKTPSAAVGGPSRLYPVFSGNSSSQTPLPAQNEEDDVILVSSRPSTATPRADSGKASRRSSVLPSTSSSRPTAANDEIERLQQVLRQKTAQLANCERDKKAFQQVKDGISDTLQEAQKKIASLEADNAGLKVQADNAEMKLQSEVQKAQEKIVSREADNERLKQEASETAEKLSEEHKRAEEKDEEHKRTIEQFQNDLEESKKKVSSLEQQIEEKQAEWQNVDEEREKRYDELVKKDEQWKQKEAALLQEKEDLMKKFNDCHEQVTKLTKEIETLNSKGKENDILHKKIAALEAQLKDIRSEKDKLEVGKTELLKKNASLKTSLDECRAGLQKKEADLQQERQKLAKESVEVRRQNKEIEEKEEEIRRLGRELYAYQSEESRLRKEKADLEARKNALDVKEAQLKNGNVPPAKNTLNTYVRRKLFPNRRYPEERDARKPSLQAASSRKGRGFCRRVYESQEASSGGPGVEKLLVVH
ncbi:hypothetical protein AAVH_17926 [Aphelenchoides avenae]|nr:hypothetical protein AAVH_17926 [Aphelenchus avenae]